jgi:P27 family predicted phage terminase small subunit
MGGARACRRRREDPRAGRDEAARVEDERVMATGRTPKPPAIRRREGNAGHRPIIDEARVGSAVACVDDFPPPVGLPDSPAAVWREIMPELVEIGLVRSIDATVLEALCRAVARARDAEAMLDRDGLVIDGVRGGLVPHPASRIARDCWALALRISGDYGLTAVSRLRLGAAVLHQRSLAEELREALDGPDDVIELAPTSVREALADLDDDADEPVNRRRRKRTPRK